MGAQGFEEDVQLEHHIKLLRLHGHSAARAPSIIPAPLSILLILFPPLLLCLLSCFLGLFLGLFPLLLRFLLFFGGLTGLVFENELSEWQAVVQDLNCGVCVTN